jgi:diadenosine tetraphosphate (Ap4A) HIT family hydrolase
MLTCPFCTPSTIDLIAENALAFAFRDRFPVSPSHTLVVTRRVDRQHERA